MIFVFDNMTYLVLYIFIIIDFALDCIYKVIIYYLNFYLLLKI